MYDTRRTTMPTLNIYLDPNSKETLDRLSGPGQRSATIREMLNKYRNNTIGAPDVTRVKVNISLSDEDKGSLDNLAKAWGVSASEAINRMITMLDREKYDQVISGDAFSSAAESTIFEDIKDWDVEELLELRASIDALLPASNLSEMNLEGELVRQYYRVVALQTRTLADERTPANQLAQVSNVVASTLQQWNDYV
jgi:hypothetical protein